MVIYPQLFDEGRLTSGSGKTLDCCEAVFVLAANLATESIKKFGTNLREKYDETSSSTEDSTESAEAPESESVGRDKYIHDFQTKLRHDEFKVQSIVSQAKHKFDKLSIKRFQHNLASTR